MRFIVIAARFAAAAAVLCAAANARAESTAENCSRDLEAIPGFLLVNDAGARDHLARNGQAVMDAALAKAREQAAQVQNEERCIVVIREYLRAWRKGHLSVAGIPPSTGTVVTATAGTPAPDGPTIKFLSPRTALLTLLPSFADRYREPLAALIKRHHVQLAAHSNWIIDVRGNGGGSDSTYQPLLPWLMPQGWIEVSAQWFVTPANIQSQQRVCDLTSPGDTECEKLVADAVSRMRGAASGSFVEQEDGDGWRHERPRIVEPRRPARVAVLMDARCGSSCDQFLLTVRQSFNVKLVGRESSAGVIDYSNLRPYDLPSGSRRLWYATSRANRLPGLPLDGIGIQPDVYLPGQANASDRAADIASTQRWLEGGSWR